MTPPRIIATTAWSDHLNALPGPWLYAGTIVPVLLQERDPAGATIDFGTGSGTEYVAQSFTVLVPCSLTTVSLRLWPPGTLPTDAASVTLESDAAGVPSGTVLASGTTQVANTWATQYAAAMSAYTLTPGTVYWVTAKRSGASDAVAYWSWYKAPPTTQNGWSIATRVYGGVWVASSGRGAAMALQLMDSALPTVEGVYAALPDKVNSRVVMHRTLDGGQTWAPVDEWGGPALSSTVGKRTVTASGDVWASAVAAVGYGDAAGTFSTREFDLVKGEWTAPSTGITTASWETNVSGTAAAWGHRRAAAHHLVFYQAASELVSGTLYRRIAVTKGTGTPFTHDPITGSATLAGTQVHYDARWAGSYASNQRFYMLWTQSDDALIRQRSLSNTNAWAAGTAAFGAIDNTAAYPLNATFNALGTSRIQVLYADGATLKKGLAPAATADTSGNWITSTVLSSAAEQTVATPGVFISDGSQRLFLWRAAPTTGTLEFGTDRSGSGWLVKPWRDGTLAATGVGGRGLSASRVGVCWLDPNAEAGPAVRYDDVWVFITKVSHSPGLTAGQIDLGRDRFSAEDPFTVALDADTAAGFSAALTAFTGDASGSYPIERTQIGVNAVDSYGEAVAGDMSRYARVEITVVGGNVIVGAFGF